ncbi:hypothetical protein C9374_005371 [Naegleria lovaniensis]|uniref:RGS domain-containing protein n=1 Tax=Naegleria lovaniensis TaxID=51637 RepID=A0AA88GJK4_NAELO|nr:uncharacterized protein C9374_005371 [Naegleria lovaniensis]KAG2382169.1 hypothetical protein C9374_005371 [Naegleria lovaniensis]
MRLLKSIESSDNDNAHKKGKQSLISRYMVVFEEVMNNKDARNCFKQFLKEETHSAEALLFLEDLNTYKTEYQNTNVEFEKDSFEKNSKSTRKMVLHLFDQAKRIITTYIDTFSITELNLGHGKATITKNWAKIDYHAKTILPDFSGCDTTSNTSNASASSNSSPKNSNWDKEGLSQLFFMLEPSTLFDSCEVNVVLDLKLDQFPLFSRSQLLDKFLIEMGETFSRSIAIDVSKGKNIDVRFKPKDFESRLLTDKDIYFAFALCEDTPDWRLFLQEEGISCYSSKTLYSFGTSALHGLHKNVFTFPYPLDKVWSVFSDRDSRLKIDEGMMPISQAFSYQAPHNTNNKALVELVAEERDQFYDDDKPPLALSLGCFGIDAKMPFVKKRFCWYAETTIYDPYADCIVTVGHSTRSFLHPREQELTQNKVIIDILYCNMFFRVNENTTRFIQTAYCDPKLPMTDGFIVNASIKSRARRFRKTFLNILETVEDDSPIMQADSFKSKQAILDNQRVYPNRSWFKEYESRKN